MVITEEKEGMINCISLIVYALSFCIRAVFEIIFSQEPKKWQLPFKKFANINHSNISYKIYPNFLPFCDEPSVIKITSQQFIIAEAIVSVSRTNYDPTRLLHANQHNSTVFQSVRWHLICKAAQKHRIKAQIEPQHFYS